jgi:hypothetical protein
LILLRGENAEGLKGADHKRGEHSGLIASRVEAKDYTMDDKLANNGVEIVVQFDPRGAMVVFTCYDRQHGTGLSLLASPCSDINDATMCLHHSAEKMYSGAGAMAYLNSRRQRVTKALCSSFVWGHFFN